MPSRWNLPGDLETPVSAFLKLRPLGAKVLLESAEQGGRLGRYTFIGLDEQASIRVVDGADPLGLLRRSLPANRASTAPGPLGGLVGYFSYDFVRFLEKLPSIRPDPLGLPLAQFIRCTSLIAFDHFTRSMTLLSETADEKRLKEIAGALKQSVPVTESAKVGGFRDTFGEAAYLAAVEKTKEHIRAGDIFQGVISRRESCDYAGDPFLVYRALRMINPSPYMFFMDFGDLQLVGSSPEVHAKLTGRRALIRPIAGTRPRGATDDEDRAAEKELLADPKERAEHLMLVDLARNDIGRVCEYGSVTCSDLYSIERYSHVMHIASQVQGTLRPDADAFDLLAATLPAGTVSGAPKVRAMEIIEELEPVRRGPYAGAAGYFSPTGDMDFCISLRTMVMAGGQAHLQAGAGIVLDSKPELEWDETTRKMGALKSALDLAARGVQP